MQAICMYSKQTLPDFSLCPAQMLLHCGLCENKYAFCSTHFCHIHHHSIITTFVFCVCTALNFQLPLAQYIPSTCPACHAQITQSWLSLVLLYWDPHPQSKRRMNCSHAEPDIHMFSVANDTVVTLQILAGEWIVPHVSIVWQHTDKCC